LGLSVEVVLREPKKPLPEEVAKRWAQEWAKEGEQVDWQRLMPSNVFGTVPYAGYAPKYPVTGFSEVRRYEERRDASREKKGPGG